MPNSIELRKAASNDIPILVEHRRRMFEDMIAAADSHPQPADLANMTKAYTQYLHAHLADGVTHAWVAEIDGRIVASGAISTLAYPPGSGIAAEHTALLHSMYTLPKYRRRSCPARRL